MSATLVLSLTFSYTEQGGSDDSSRRPTAAAVAILRMDSVAIVVDDPTAAVAFFVEPGLELEGQHTI